MKRLFSCILILIYFVTSSGFVVNMHYCMDRFDTISIGAADKKCNVCGMENGESNCCHDETLRVKSGDDHSAATITLLQPPAEFIEAPTYDFNYPHTEIQTGVVYYSANAPPPFDDFLSLFCIWRI